MKTAGSFRFAGSSYRGRAAMAPHGHGVPYVSFVLNGTYEEQVGKETRVCAANDVVTHSEGEVHSVRFQSGETRILRIESDEYFGKGHGIRSATLDSAKLSDPVFGQIATRIWLELKNWDRFSPLAVEGLMLEMVARLCRAESTACDAATPDRISLAEEFLRTEFANEVTLEKVAEAVGIHPVQLSREFRKRKGVTFGEYLRLIRVRAACRELARGDSRLCDIALGAGFCDQSHFSNTFRKIMGTTPSEYRRSVRNS